MGQALNIGQAFSMAMTCFDSGKLAEAEAICRQITEADPRNPMGFQFLGLVLNTAGKYKDAVKPLRQAIKLKKDDAGFYLNLGIALRNTDELAEAEVLYKRALALNPDLSDAYLNLAALYRAQGKKAEARALYIDVMRRSPNNVQVHYTSGVFLAECGATEDALRALERVTVWAPAYAEGYAELGLLHAHMGQHEQAIALLKKALSLNPRLAAAYLHYAAIMIDLQRFDEAIGACQQGLALPASDKDKAALYFNMGQACRHQKKLGDAIDAYEKSYALNPASALTLAELVHQLYHVCAWDKIGTREQEMMALLRAGKSGVPPFVAMAAMQATPADLLQAAKIYSQRYVLPASAQFQHERSQKEGRLRIGYLSCDFHSHATAVLAAGMFESHDKTRFETVAYSYGIDDQSAMRQRLTKAFDHFHDIRALSHKAAAEKIRADGIDILVDLKGYTSDVRPQIMAYRPAPVQAQFLGYPGTMGAPFIDYIIADPVIVPPGHDKFYSEKVVRLTRCYQPNDKTRKAAETPTRAACGLPENGFVFCSFNSAYKIHPDIFAIWMRLLKEVPGSVLWQLQSNAMAGANLQKAAAAAGIDPARIIFAPFASAEANLARQPLADLFLDALPVNAHTTASDAVWMGVPVVTCMGDKFAGRVASSILQAANMPELVTDTLQDYEALALALAKDPARLQGLRQKMSGTRDQMPLFDIQQFTRDIESAYETMWQGGVRHG